MITEFYVNGTNASYEVTPYEEGDEKYLIYEVIYPTSYKDRAYQISCNINENLTIRFKYDRSFWDLDGIDQTAAVQYNQNKLDQEVNMQTVRWENGAEDVDYAKDGLYRMTGTVLAFGKYMGNLTDKYYITLNTSLGIVSSAHCYFTAEEWANAPSISYGETITFYGYYDFWMFGWDFHDCTFNSPSGTFIINSNGAPEIIYGNPSTYYEPSPSTTAPSNDEELSSTTEEVFLTNGEMADLTDYFNTTEHNGLLRFPYDGISDPDMGKYLPCLFYDLSDDTSNISDAELEELRRLDIDLSGDVYKFSTDYILNYLSENFGEDRNRIYGLLEYSFDQLGTYLSEYDAYYNTRYDTAWSPYTFDTGSWLDDSTVRLYYTSNIYITTENGELDMMWDQPMYVDLKPYDDGGWYIIQNCLDK